MMRVNGGIRHLCSPRRSHVLNLDRTRITRQKDLPKIVHLIVLVEEDSVINILLIYATIISSWILRMKERRMNSSRD